jgi:hypothetical protein
VIGNPALRSWVGRHRVAWEDIRLWMMGPLPRGGWCRAEPSVMRNGTMGEMRCIRGGGRRILRGRRKDILMNMFRISTLGDQSPATQSREFAQNAAPLPTSNTNRQKEKQLQAGSKQKRSTDVLYTMARRNSVCDGAILTIDGLRWRSHVSRQTHNVERKGSLKNLYHNLYDRFI